MPSLDADRFADAAAEAARRGGAVVAEAARRSRPVRVDEKSSRDFVTEIDRAAERAIKEFLEGSFPDHAILAEETPGERSAPPGYQWVVDPLDGTTNFIHRFPVFAVSVGLRLDGSMVAGAVYDVMRGELFRAERGRGTTLDGEPVRVSDALSLEHALLATGFPFREHARTSAYVEVFENLMRATAGVRRPGAASLDLAYVACGRVDGFWEAGLAPWDVAAGSLLVEEAGGVVSDFHGGDRHVDGGDIVASTPALHDSLLDAMDPLRPDRS
jgi:myo-inositol-1(or 4)-monophosphatase